jgi:hypothetical protein
MDAPATYGARCPAQKFLHGIDNDWMCNWTTSKWSAIAIGYNALLLMYDFQCMLIIDISQHFDPDHKDAQHSRSTPKLQNLQHEV